MKLCEAWQKVLYCANYHAEFLRDCLVNEKCASIFTSLAITDRTEEALNRCLQYWRTNFSRYCSIKSDQFFKIDALLASANCLMHIGVLECLKDTDWNSGGERLHCAAQ